MLRESILLQRLRERVSSLKERLRDGENPITSEELSMTVEDVRALESALDAENRLHLIAAWKPLAVVIGIVVLGVILLSHLHVSPTPVQAEVTATSVRIFPETELAFVELHGTALLLSDMSESPRDVGAAAATTKIESAVQLHRLALPRGSAVELSFDKSASTLRIAPLCIAHGGCVGGRLMASRRVDQASDKSEPLVFWLQREPTISVSIADRSTSSAVLRTTDIDSMSFSRPEELLTPRGMRTSSTSGLVGGTLRLISPQDSFPLTRHGQFEVAGSSLTVDEVGLQNSELIVSLHGDVTTLQRTVGPRLEDARPNVLRLLVSRLGGNVTLVVTLVGFVAVAVLRSLALRVGRAS